MKIFKLVPFVCFAVLLGIGSAKAQTAVSSEGLAGDFYNADGDVAVIL